MFLHIRYDSVHDRTHEIKLRRRLSMTVDIPGVPALLPKRVDHGYTKMETDRYKDHKVIIVHGRIASSDVAAYR